MAGEPTSHVRLYGLYVKDQELYRRYRAGMTPILHGYGGDFGYDFEVGQVLKSESERPINRVFTIRFPDRASADRFFADDAYLAVRHALFVPAVSDITTIASFEERGTMRE